MNISLTNNEGANRYVLSVDEKEAGSLEIFLRDKGCLIGEAKHDDPSVAYIDVGEYSPKMITSIELWLEKNGYTFARTPKVVPDNPHEVNWDCELRRSQR